MGKWTRDQISKPFFQYFHCFYEIKGPKIIFCLWANIFQARPCARPTALHVFLGFNPSPGGQRESNLRGAYWFWASTTSRPIALVNLERKCFFSMSVFSFFLFWFIFDLTHSAANVLKRKLTVSNLRWW